MSEHEHNMKATGNYYTPLACDECDFALSSNGLEELYLSEKAAVVRMNQAEDAMARMMDEKAALEAKLSKMEELERLRDYVQARRNSKPETGDYVMIPVAELDKALAGGEEA